MSTYKQITFLRAGEPVMRMVDLDQLSPQAKELAEAVSSTVCYDDASVVYVQSNLSNEQYWRNIAEGGDFGSNLSMGFAAYMLAEYRAGKYRHHRDAHPKQEYLWDGLRLSESPEEYFERHATFIREHNWVIVL